MRPIQAETAVEKYTRPIISFITETINNYFPGTFAEKENSEEEEILLPKIPEIKDKAMAIQERGDSKSPDDVALNAKSEEVEKYNYLFLADLFLAVKNREIREEEVASWMNVLGQKGTREGIYRALVLDSEYRGLEQIKGPVSTGAIEFTQDIFGKFLNMEVSSDAISQFNGHTVKRIVTENALEVIDALYAQSPDDFYNWYAVFSSDLAKAFADNMQGEIRKNSSKRIHREWVKEVPLQHAKAEVIIKLHMIYNKIM